MFMQKRTHYEQPLVQLDDVGDLKSPDAGVPVGEVELEADAGVAADDDEKGEHQVDDEHGDDEGEAVLLHPHPGQGAGQAEGFGAVPAPAHDGEQGPGESVQPDPHAQDLRRPPAYHLP